ncbi:LuxR C-terminal-related transcriptional regulator [Aneurinibacillus migulanus]|uniref:LuxR C-terminal-related transcriptional regulator n=1 Tax=Aneurinibacillus migulanus TaxID=47500 RepID=UPI00209E98D3|nr:LuxR C-terminal-related transcriptional regulator [Aneurinibacillus migulanus]MCP1359307.1 LuxR C-terminal-related transcriptional regulator [Aneurinibacillus migulanus]
MRTQMEDIKQKIITLEKEAVTSWDYRKALIGHLRKAVPFDGACCTMVDPQTLLSTGAVTEDGIEAIHHRLFEYEYVHEDFNTYHQLVQADDPVATLSGATKGELERSARYRNVLLPAGFKDEMRAALRYQGKCWGYLTLFRYHDRPFFHENERKFISSLVPVIAFNLRKRNLVLPSEELRWMEKEPGILVLSDQLTMLSSNAAAKHWLSLLQKWEGIDSHILPRPIRAVCSRAFSSTSVGTERFSLAKVCIHIPEGPYLTIQASQLSGPSATLQLAVWLELAKPSDMLPFISEAYGLSEREKQVLDRIVRGFSTKELALSLHISTYTVQDHLKSIFMKTGVTSRRELIWLLFSRFSMYLAGIRE